MVKHKQRKLNKTIRTVALLAGLGASSVAWASTPDWLRQAAQSPIPSYSDDTAAVKLLDETTTTVTSNGEVHITCRRAYKILRPQGRSLGTVTVAFDSETQLSFLKGWSISARNEEYEVKEKDAVETSIFLEELYSDTRHKLLVIPASQPGSVIGYEYQQKQRASILQQEWLFQSDIPVRRARFVLELPRNWNFHTYWRNHRPVDPQKEGENRWTWELTDVEAIREEPQMPNWRSVAGHLGVSFAPSDSERDFSSWTQIGRWYSGLTSNRREVTPQIRAKARDLVAGATDDFQKISRLAAYVQNDIRYVAIEIGIGGYQPHPAQQIFTSGYGDCKDKATLLATMLADVGIESYYVLINDDREYVSPDFPSALSFNHAILAIHISEKPEQQYGTLAALDHKQLGTLLLFDPTDTSTPLGYLPAPLQANYALLVAEKGSELVKLPLIPPSMNRILRTGNLELDASGDLKGSIQEVRSGPAATAIAQRFRNLPAAKRQEVFEDLLAEVVDGAVLKRAAMSNVSQISSSMTLSYTFVVPSYAQRSGSLFLFRPCAVCRPASDLLEGKPRKHPLVFPYATSESEVFDISYPADLTVDEMPQPANYQHRMARYTSDLHSAEHVLHYQRTYELKDVRASLDEMEDLKKFFRHVAEDESSYVILKSPLPK